MKKAPLILGIVLALSVTASVAVPVDQSHSLPSFGLGQYSEFRQALLAKGWKGMPQKRGAVAGIPEVVCGNKVCGANWESPDGSRHLSFTLWPTYPFEDDTVVLLVAPETSDLKSP